jgi:hypothetical protein
MAALPDPLYSPALRGAAPGLSDYQQFTAYTIPDGCGAIAAYKGFIRPFSDDATARRVLQAVEEGRSLQVSGGRVDADLPEQRVHDLDPLLVKVAVPFTVLLLEFPAPERPRAYLLDPPMVHRVSMCSHLRHDKSIEISGRKIPALCVYSGALEKFDPCRSILEQQLDQTATYLAKYLIWLRTRQLFRHSDAGRQLVRQRRAQRKIDASKVLESPGLFFDGFWPGPSAPSGPFAHLGTIKPDDECWCWSGKLYGECCRARELAEIAEIERRSIRIEFVHKLVAAVHARLNAQPLVWG